MAKKNLKGRRMHIFITNGYDKTELRGVQAFGYKSNVTKEGHSEYGSDGEVITITSFDNITGSLDIQDQYDAELNEARAMMTGRRGDDKIGIDFAVTTPVWLWKNNYDPDDVSKTKVISSDLIREAVFDEDYKSELKTIHTRSFAFQGLRGINFPEHAISFEKWSGTDTFTFSKEAVQYNSPGLDNSGNADGYVLALFINGVLSMDKIDTATNSELTITDTLTETDEVTALILYDGKN